MNKRYLPCKEKQVYAIGQEGSLSDNKEQLKHCLECYKFIICKQSQTLFQYIINQQDNFISLYKI